MSDLNFTEINIWLSWFEGIGSLRLLNLLDSFDNPAKIWYANVPYLMRNGGFSEDLAKKVVSRRNIDDLRSYIKNMEQKNISCVTIRDEKYPALLRQIDNPPVLLYVLGEIPDDGAKKVSIIGSRISTEYGRNTAYKLSYELAQNGVTVVSGMAKGIDAVAHKGAIEGGGKTIAVLGCGLDICYPAENLHLRNNIPSSGCVISEYPLGSPPDKYHFPARNRIISGLSLATVVIEAGERSGTLITAGLAADQGRDVLAVPGNITNPKSNGTNALLRDGAGLVLNCKDVLDAIGINSPYNVPAPPKTLTDKERAVYEIITDAPLTCDKIVLAAGLPFGEIFEILILLETKKYIKKIPGNKYVRFI
ncbi:DNA processing protein DprA [Clostridia bacterium]|nr:DNA processing protein DprA [Clostridia bacterium]